MIGGRMLARRVLAGILILGMLLGLTGCMEEDKDESSHENSDSIYDIAINENNSECVFIEDSSFTSISEITDIYVKKDLVYYYKYENNDKVSFCRVNDKGENEQLGTIDIKNGEYVLMMVPSVDDQVGIVVTNNTDFKLYEYDGNSLIDKGYINSAIGPDVGVVVNMFRVEDGYVAVMMKQIIKYDKNFKKISEASCKVGCSCLDKNGNVVIAYNRKEDGLNVYGGLKTIISVYDVSSCEITNKIEISLGEMMDISTGTGENDIYIYSDDVYGIKYTDELEEKIVSLSESFIFQKDYVRLILKDDETLYVAEYNYEDEIAFRMTLKRFKRIVPQNSTDTDVDSEQADITVAVLNGTTTYVNITKLINLYNKSQSKYQIKMIDYTKHGFHYGMEALGKDISEGKIPDIIDVSGNILGDISLEEAISNGILEDMGPYIESDESLSTSDFIPSVYETMKTNGKLYFVSPSFSVECLFTLDKQMVDGYRWSVEEWKNYIESYPSDYAISSNRSDITTFTQYSNRMISNFVDWETRGGYFDSHDFKSILTTCDRMNPEDDMDQSLDELEWLDHKIRKNEYIMAPGILSDDKEYIWYKDRIKNMKIKGYPSLSGSGILAHYDLQIAMSANCTNKEAAWDFVRYCLSKEIYDKEMIPSEIIPAREDAYKEYMKKQSGQTDVRALTADEEKEYRDVIDNISGRYYYDFNIDNIIYGEAQYYYSGEKTIEEVCLAIEKKVNDYLR